VKIKNGVSKWMLREIVKELLGNEVAFAPKRPLQTPQREWMSNELKGYIEKQVAQFNSICAHKRKGGMGVYIFFFFFFFLQYIYNHPSLPSEYAVVTGELRCILCFMSYRSYCVFLNKKSTGEQSSPIV
jgi:hypothetical protein